MNVNQVAACVLKADWSIRQVSLLVSIMQTIL